LSGDITLEEYKDSWREMTVREARNGFLAHFVTYVIINGFLIFLNLWSSPNAIWFPWILAGWGIGLASHGIFSRAGHVLNELKKREALAELMARERRKQT